MQNFIRVTKDNKRRDRGFIAIDAICSAFENQEAHNTQIMTMDGYWYDVVDDIDKIYAVCENANTVYKEKKSKSDFLKTRRMQSSALSEKGGQLTEQGCCVESEPIEKKPYEKTSTFTRGRSRYRGRENSGNFSSGGEEGRCRQPTKGENDPKGGWM